MFKIKFHKLTFFVFIIQAFTLNAFANWDACPYEGTKIDRSELININRPAGMFSYVCEAPVESFNIVFKQLAMCTADPTDFLNGTSEVDPCIYLMNTNTGDSELSIGITSSAETSFQATFPPTGTYTHGYTLLDKTIGITAEYEINDVIFAANENGNAWQVSTFFGPGNRTVTMKNLVDDLWQLSTEGFTSSQSSKNTINFAYDSFSTSQFLNTLSQTHPTTGNAQIMYLTNSDGKVASTFSEVQDVLIVDTYASPTIITDQTSEISFKYSPDLAGRIIWEETMGQWVAFGFMLGNIKFSMEFN